MNELSVVEFFSHGTVVFINGIQRQITRAMKTYGRTTKATLLFQVVGKKLEVT